MDSAIDLAKLPPLEGWLPIHVDWDQTPAAVDWCHVGKRRLLEPFFEQTVEKCLRDPFNLLFRHQSALEVLTQWQRLRPGLPPNGFIFHMSRCGSTLLAQMLATLPKNIVISEAPPIDSMLRPKSRGVTEEQQVAWLRGLLSALGQRRNEEEKYFFVKFDSWHTHNLTLIQRAFPKVPWIFLYRDPREVLMSQLQHPGLHMVPGLVESRPPETSFSTNAPVPAEERCVQVLASICTAAIDQLRTGSGRAVNYTELPDSIWTWLREYFQLDYSVAEISRMRDVAQFDAKTPSLFFKADSERKRNQLTALGREMSARWLEPVYAELEVLRGGQERIQAKTAS